MKMTKVGFCISFLFCGTASAELLQVLHTNDLHSHLEHYIHQKDVGGYARLKTLMREEREKAQAQGIGTIAMDGGDFMEGNIFYMADKGKKTFEAFGNIGYDVAVIGNHDYLMGAPDLEEILRDVPPTYNLLGANFKVDSSFKEINEHVKPVWETVIGGVKVGVIGITTNDLLFEWRLKGDAKVKNEISAARHYAKYLRKRGNEVIIALTHIGVSKDKKLAFNVPEIDLIVGGHSHTKLTKVLYKRSRNGKQIPIVQTGSFGQFLGRLLLDYNRENKKLTVKEYELIPVTGVAQDPEMNLIIEDANRELDNLYGGEWLNSVIGHSFLRPRQVENDEHVWHYFITDSMLESSQSDFAFHVSPLSGENYPLGAVKRRDLYNSNPRTFDYNDKMGYHVYTANVSGALVGLLAPIVLNFNLPLYITGLTFKWKKKSNGKYVVWDIRHNGKIINPFKRYKMAMSEAIVRGAYEISPLTKILMGRGARTDTSMWQALEDKFLREGIVDPNYLERYYRDQKSSGKAVDRMMVIPE